MEEILAIIQRYKTRVNRKDEEASYLDGCVPLMRQVDGRMRSGGDSTG
jgi:hypothetical protein